MISFQDLPKFTRSANRSYDIGWDRLEFHLAQYIEWSLDLDPDFQRAHVWTRSQQVRYIEFIVMGGGSGKDILTNCPGWDRGGTQNFVLVDGKQRIEAVRAFLRNDFPVFGEHFFRDIKSIRFTTCSFKWHVNDLETRAEVLQWYLDVNGGGVVHTDEELNRVRGLLDAEKGGGDR